MVTKWVRKGVKIGQNGVFWGSGSGGYPLNGPISGPGNGGIEGHEMGWDYHVFYASPYMEDSKGCMVHGETHGTTTGSMQSRTLQSGDSGGGVRQ